MASNERFVRFVQERMASLGMDKKQLSLKVVGAPRRSSFESVISGRSRARWPTLDAMGQALGVRPQQLFNLYDPLPEGVALAKSFKPKPTEEAEPARTPAKQTVLPRAQPVFQFSVNADATADVKLDLKGVPLNVAMDVVNTLQRSGFFTAEAYAHGKPEDHHENTK